MALAVSASQLSVARTAHHHQGLHLSCSLQVGSVVPWVSTLMSLPAKSPVASLQHKAEMANAIAGVSPCSTRASKYWRPFVPKYLQEWLKLVEAPLTEELKATGALLVEAHSWVAPATTRTTQAPVTRRSSSRGNRSTC